MTISTGVTFVLLFFHAFAKDMGYLIPIRVILGITFAIIEGAGKTIICEIVPLKMRGRIVSWLFVCFILGVISNGIVCLIMWDDVDDGNW
jgi:MFS family permease